ncbi:hypothetical protein RJ639_035649 [Escallonia herrerae]|uniref:Uncharacterized protein n=1 Tax=Escallonia herrerae TaxID=1293975 RepID=A0AA88WSG7_9ASTE|nr:hypothetical protein RJ639_035649 [Escallonia herrerae]
MKKETSRKRGNVISAESSRAEGSVYGGRNEEGDLQEESNLSNLGTDKTCICQFNFNDFDAAHDTCASDSIELLRWQGIDFEKNLSDGVDLAKFVERMMGLGLVCNDSVSWVTFYSVYSQAMVQIRLWL